jgi:hypothetical protein
MLKWPRKAFATARMMLARWLPAKGARLIWAKGQLKLLQRSGTAPNATK